METPTIVKQTKQYLLVKIPLPVQEREIITVPEKPKKTSRAEHRLLGIIQEGEQEYQAGKTVRARSIDEALKIHGRKKN